MSALLSFEEAHAQFLAAARRVKGEDRLPLDQALGRVLHEALASPINVPSLANSAMDGYALRLADVPASGARLKIAQRIIAGRVGEALQPGTAARIFTGAPVPGGADAVVMQEDCVADGDTVVINRVPKRGECIRAAGEDIQAGSAVLPAGCVLNAQALGLAASCGVAQITVYRQLNVGLIATGNELIAPGQPLPPGGVYNSNRVMLVSLLRQLGCAVEDFGQAPDDLEKTRASLRRAAALCDVVITTGGVSVGEEDHVKAAVAAEGELSLWRIAIKPGKPLACGKIGTADFIGLPGNPVSAFVTFLLLVKPFLRQCQGALSAAPRGLFLPAAFEWSRPGERREFLRARVNQDGALELFPNQGSGVLTSTQWADGLIDNPPGQAIRQGDTVRYLSFAELMK